MCLVTLLPHRLSVAKHVYPNPAPKQEVKPLGVNLDTPWLAQGEDTDEHKNDACKFGDLGETTSQHGCFT